MPIVGDRETNTGVEISKVEQCYGVTFIGDFCLKDGERWLNFPVAIFYQPEPSFEKGHTHYLGVYVKHFDTDHGGKDVVMLCNGEPAIKDVEFDAIRIDYEFIYSSYRHDMAGHGGFFIDGGRDYVKISGEHSTEVSYKFVVVRDKIKMLVRT